jgi:hypothetical protein
MVKRFLALLAAIGLVLSVSSVAFASRHNFETRGSRDYAPRIVGYVLFPVGVLLDFVIFRPISYVACGVPDLTGCGPEDRRALGLDGDRVYEVPSER